MNIQDWFPSRWTNWISLLSKGLSRVFSNTTVHKHQFFGAQLSWAYILRKTCFFFPQKDTYISAFISMLLTTAKTWKQSKCPSTDEWIKEIWYIYIMEYCSAFEKNEIMPLETTWIDPEIIVLRKYIRQRKTNIVWYHLYAESKRRIQINLFKKQK